MERRVMGNYHARCGAGEKPEVVTPEAYLSLFGEIPDFPSKLSTMRKYNISATIVLQDLSQIQSMYKDEWRTIMANCDSTVFLGNSEPETLKYFSEKLGNMTITVRSRGRSFGGKSGSTQNFQQVKRETLPAEEIGRLPNEECLVFTRGERPTRDNKYDYINHPNYQYTGDADGKNNFKYNEMLEYNNQAVPGYQSLLRAEAAVMKLEEGMEGGVSDAKSANDAFPKDPNLLLEMIEFSKEEEKAIFVQKLTECQKQMDEGKKILKISSARASMLPNLFRALSVENSEEKVLIVSHNGGEALYACGKNIPENEYCEDRTKTEDGIVTVKVSIKDEKAFYGTCF